MKVKEVRKGKARDVTVLIRKKPSKSTKIHPTNQIYNTFKKSARVLGEVEAGMSALFELLERSGLMRAPAGKVVTMDEDRANRVLEEARRITDLLSYEAKSIIPCLLVAVGDPSALRQYGLQPGTQREDDTVH